MPQLQAHLHFAQEVASLFQYMDKTSVKYNEYLLGATLPDGIISVKVDRVTLAFKYSTHFYIHDDTNINPLPDITAFIAKYRAKNILSSDLLRGYLTHLALDFINNLYWNNIIMRGKHRGRLIVNDQVISVPNNDLLKYKYAGMNFLDEVSHVDFYPNYNELTDSGIRYIKQLGIYETLCKVQPASLERLEPSPTDVTSPIDEYFCRNIYKQTEMYLTQLINNLCSFENNWDEVFV